MQATMQPLHLRLRGKCRREGGKIVRGRGPGHMLLVSVL